MKKIFLILLTMLMFFVTTACNDKINSTTNEFANKNLLIIDNETPLTNTSSKSSDIGESHNSSNKHTTSSEEFEYYEQNENEISNSYDEYNEYDENIDYNSDAIYRTPYGKRYHLDPDCGGKNSYEISLDEALDAGLTPCKKCAM